MAWKYLKQQSVRRERRLLKAAMVDRGVFAVVVSEFCANERENSFCTVAYSVLRFELGEVHDIRILRESRN